LALPDAPRWIDTRGALIGGRCRIVPGGGESAGDAPCCLVVSEEFPFAGVVGRPAAKVIRDVVAGPRRLELLAQAEDIDHLGAALPGWIRELATLHTLPETVERRLVDGAPASGDGRDGEFLWPVGSSPPLDHMRAELREELETVLKRTPLASVVVDGRPVSVCSAAVETESWWDVSVETLEPHRGQGLAGRCFALLAAALAGQGKRAVWGGHASNAGSLRAAAKLGFEPVDEIWTLRGPDA
jgi:GNAT superfamily N-acetyltransferase